MHTLHIIDSEQFAEATAEAQEAANAAILERAREMAMAGDSSVMTTWMKALIPALRPANNVNVAVGVRTGERTSKLTDEQIVERLNRIVADSRMRAEAALKHQLIDVEAVEPLPSAQAALQAPAAAEGIAESTPATEAPVKPAISPSVEDLL